jgi:CcmD family protein
MKQIAKILLLTGLFFTAQAQEQAEMADTFRSDGKIFVVVAIILVIFIGLISYLFLMDRKITRIEKRLPNKKA